MIRYNEKVIIISVLLLVYTTFVFSYEKERNVKNVEKISLKEIALPAAKHDSKTSVEKALSTRRSIRKYKNKPIELTHLGQLLWAAQGITSKQGMRTAPSAGALYPMELYIVVENIANLAPGVYKYNCKKHTLMPIKSGSFLAKLAQASLRQSWVSGGAAAIVITGIFERTSAKYGSRATQYVHMEAGHIAQNIYLQGISLEIGTVTVGAFEDAKVQKVIGAQKNELPLYVMPIGAK